MLCLNCLFPNFVYVSLSDWCKSMCPLFVSVFFCIFSINPELSCPLYCILPSLALFPLLHIILMLSYVQCIEIFTLRGFNVSDGVHFGVTHIFSVLVPYVCKQGSNKSTWLGALNFFTILPSVLSRQSGNILKRRKHTPEYKLGLFMRTFHITSTSHCS